jgi:SpoVK/Ycf46/Vps4 family AAA+-type ATPase
MKACTEMDLLSCLAGKPLVDIIIEISQAVKDILTSHFQHSEAQRMASHVVNGTSLTGANTPAASCTSVQAIVIEAILLPRKFAAIYSTYGVFPPTAVLLHGPPGTGMMSIQSLTVIHFIRSLLFMSGKTWIAAAVAKEISGHFVSMKLSDILSGHVGVAESRVREVFREAMQYAPAVVFIDEFQALFTSRSGDDRGGGLGGGSTLTSTLSGCLDDISAWNANAGVNSLVTVIAATNEPWAIDAGFLRPGRFDKVLYVGPMNAVERLQLISAHMEKLRAVVVVDIDPVEVTSRTEGFTAADIGHLFQCVADEYMTIYCATLENDDIHSKSACSDNSSSEIEKEKQGMLSVSWGMVEQAFSNVRPSCSAREVEEYVEWEAERYRLTHG